MPVVLSFLARALRNGRRFHEDDGSTSLPGATVETKRRTCGLVGFPQSYAPERAILTGFLEQPWFHRVWIVQEVVMAQEAKVMMGDWEMQWEPFAQAIDILGESNLSTSHFLKFHGPEDLWNGLPLLSIQYLSLIRQLPGRTNCFLPLLNDSRQRKATNPADHVFAVSGMASQIVNPGPNHVNLSRFVTIDYNKPTAQVFRDATWFIIRSQGKLDPFHMLELSDDPMQDCPSWVPLWTEPLKSERLPRALFNADLGKLMDVRYHPHDDNKLMASRYAFERVQALNTGLQLAAQRIANINSNPIHYPPRGGDVEFVTSDWNLVESFQMKPQEMPGCCNGAINHPMPRWRHLSTPSAVTGKTVTRGPKHPAKS
ncbi:hypothetical protein LCI18_012794 [Fusarium solani-melongenae]|uniref:Uncharacterized protein n=1 Tax=Fusarium solani subsp. cucurbitae TaxID=2747967 RepID=A0ACD3ZKJ3_FUSSC|nr:hypothetical protein LCI18_012794 [Fusarium solani-melongenae]